MIRLAWPEWMTQRAKDVLANAYVVGCVCEEVVDTGPGTGDRSLLGAKAIDLEVSLGPDDTVKGAMDNVGRVVEALAEEGLIIGTRQPPSCYVGQGWEIEHTIELRLMCAPGKYEATAKRVRELQANIPAGAPVLDPPP